MSRLAGVILFAFAVLGCTARRPADLPPSILLVVLDTVRADAVSAYGAVSDTTPFLDQLARDGVLYRNAYSNAPWTLPAHATLFTGMLPAEHGAGFRSWRAPEQLPTLASVLAAAGYRTGGFSENPLAGPLTNLDQGFSTFETFGREASAEGQLPGALARWLDENRGSPFFAFVNIIDAHSPYEVHEENRFLPRGADAELAAEVAQATMPAPLCHMARAAGELAVLRGLYLGDVAAADRKLAAIQAAARTAAGSRELITIVTSDHGESFGEQRLMGHLFGVGNQILKVPLVVNGAPGARASVIETPVQLSDVYASVLYWAGVPISGEQRQKMLPEANRPGTVRPVLVQYQDPAKLAAAQDAPLFGLIADHVRQLRVGCRPEDRVFGAIDAVISFPYKAVAFERHPPALFDLASDPDELRNLATARPATTAQLLRALQERTQ